MKRYNAVVGGVYDPSVMVEEKDGDYVWYEDVERIEAIKAELLEAATNVVEWWDSDSGVSPSAYGLIDQLRAAIAKAKGESNE